MKLEKSQTNLNAAHILLTKAQAIHTLVEASAVPNININIRRALEKKTLVLLRKI